MPSLPSKFNGEKRKVDLSAKPDHTGAVEALMEELKAHDLDSRIGAIGHRCRQRRRIVQRIYFG